MKKVMTFATILGASLLSACSQNAPQNQVFGQTSNQEMTIAQIKNQYDDALVSFTGKIVRQIDNEDYIVADQTGEIQVEIDHHVWNGVNVTPADTVRIWGKVDKETFSTQVDAKRIEKVQ